jgi:hypothetical protein
MRVMVSHRVDRKPHNNFLVSLRRFYRGASRFRRIRQGIRARAEPKAGFRFHGQIVTGPGWGLAGPPFGDLAAPAQIWGSPPRKQDSETSHPARCRVETGFPRDKSEQPARPSCVMKHRHTSAIPQHHAPGFWKFVRPQNDEGAVRSQEGRRATLKRGRREDRVRAAPAVSCARVDKKTHMSIQVQRKQSGLPCAMALRLISCSPRRDQSLFVTVAREKRELLADLTPAIGASGPHDFAVRFTRCSSKAHPRPPLPAPTSVTMANAPSTSGRDGDE